MSLLSEDQPVRINKYLALSGIESRRAADELIKHGRVSVNGTLVTEPGMKVTSSDFVKVDDKRVQPLPKTVILLNKPRGFICSRSAQSSEATTIYDLLPPKLQHLTYAGRLDSDSEGLVIMTNDGDLVEKVTHPSKGIEKEYWVTLDQSFDNSVLSQLLRGLTLPEGHAKAKYVKRTSARRAIVVLEQGLKRQVRQMFQCLGLRVTKLVRVRVGSLWGGDLEPGAYTLLTDEQVALAMVNPPEPKSFYKPDPNLGTLKHKPHYTGAPIHPGQEVGPRKSDSEFTTEEFKPEEEEVRGNTKFGDEETHVSPRESRGGYARGGRGSFGERPRRDSGDRERSFGDRPPRRDFGGDRGGRSFGDRPPRRDFDGDRPRRSFGDRDQTTGDRPRRDFGDRPRRSFGDRENSFGDRPRRSFGDRERSFGDRPRRDFGDRERSFGDRPPRRDFNDRPRPSFDGDKPGNDAEGGERPNRFFGDRPPRREFSDRPRRDFGDRPPRRDFGGDRGGRNFGDRPPRRNFDGDRPRRSFGDRDQTTGDRPRREFDGDRPRRSFGDRPPRRDFGGDRGGRSFGGDRPRKRF